MLKTIHLYSAPNITGNANVCQGWGGLADTGALYRSGNSQAPTGGAANGINLYLNGVIGFNG